jgi:hypothetical protein
LIDSWSCRVDSVCIGCAQGLQLLGPGVLEWLVLYITASPRSESHLACADVNPARVLLYSANSRNHGVVLTCGRSEPTSRCRWRCMVSIHAYGLLSLGYLFFFARRLCRGSSVHRCVWQECTGGVSYARGIGRDTAQLESPVLYWRSPSQLSRMRVHRVKASTKVPGSSRPGEDLRVGFSPPLRVSPVR